MGASYHAKTVLARKSDSFCLQITLSVSKGPRKELVVKGSSSVFSDTTSSEEILARRTLLNRPSNKSYGYLKTYIMTITETLSYIHSGFGYSHS